MSSGFPGRLHDLKAVGGSIFDLVNTRYIIIKNGKLASPDLNRERCFLKFICERKAAVSYNSYLRYWASRVRLSTGNFRPLCNDITSLILEASLLFSSGPGISLQQKTYCREMMGKDYAIQLNSPSFTQNSFYPPFPGTPISKKIHIPAFPWNFRYYFWLYHDFLILRCFFLLKKDRKHHSVLNANDKNVSFRVFNPTTCCFLPSFPNKFHPLIWRIHTYTFLLDQVFSNVVTYRSLSQQTGVQNQAQTLFPYSCLSSNCGSRSGQHFHHFSLCIGCKKENAEWGRAAAAASAQPE